MDSPARPVAPAPSSQNPGSARADRVNLDSANKAIFRENLNAKLRKESKEEAADAFQALRAIRDKSPMINTTAFEKLS